ncbi:hypothetical protein [Anabaena sp. AL93]|uniref:hypothetical protein n=1 Tax=Anabaena sp. AL93 TaxID=1678133 RepID=UPI000A6CBC22|nr:hypothetical protein [Anabaena sp. AL93]
MPLAFCLAITTIFNANLLTGDVVTFYQGVRGLTNSESYSSGYYLELMAKKRDELLSVVEPQGDVGKQLSLF